MKTSIILVLLYFVGIDAAPPTHNDYWTKFSGQAFVFNELEEFDENVKQNKPLNKFYEPLLNHLNQELERIYQLIPGLEQLINSIQEGNVVNVQEAVDQVHAKLHEVMYSLPSVQEWIERRIKVVRDLVVGDEIGTIMTDDANKLTAIKTKIASGLKFFKKFSRFVSKIVELLLRTELFIFKKESDPEKTLQDFLKLKELVDKKEFLTVIIDARNQVNEIVNKD